MSCPDCISGSVVDYKPLGSIQTIDGIQCYISDAKGNNEKLVVLCSDIFGIQQGLPNMQKISDRITEALCITCIVPDVFDGRPPMDPSTMELMDTLGNKASGFCAKMGACCSILGRVVPFLCSASAKKARTTAILEKVLRAKKGAAIAMVGYCWGGGQVVKFAGRDDADDLGIKCIVAAHPAMLSLPADINKLKKSTCFILPEQDWELKLPQIAQIKDLCGKRQEALNGSFKYSVHSYPDMKHGFAARGDESKEEVRVAKDDALNKTIEFIRNNL